MIIPYLDANLFVKMNKPSFRARPLEVSKPMPIYMSEELPGLPEYSEFNRAVPQMPTGMKKEEESEHHLQRAIVTGLIIPTPEVHLIPDMDDYDRLYPPTYKTPRQLIHMQPFSMEQDIPDYDVDSEDEKWLAAHSKVFDISTLKFEEMMDRLEKCSGHSAVNLKEAKLLLKEDEDLITTVYDYWLNKRLNTQQSLIPCVKTEANRGNNSNNNTYLAFRRRTEKIQTRKIRKNDESTYEKMVKLKRDLSRALNLLDFVKRREASKRQLLQLTVDIFEKRYKVQDFNGQLLSEVSAMRTPRPAFAPIFSNQYNNGNMWQSPSKDEYVVRKEKRQYKKRKHKSVSVTLPAEDVYRESSPTSPVKDDSPFTFWQNRQCVYSSPVLCGLANWPWVSQEEGGLADKRYRFSLTSIAHPSERCIGLARRRMGRGGRVILDRVGPPMDDYWASLDFTIQGNCREEKPQIGNQNVVEENTLVKENHALSKEDDRLLKNDDMVLRIDDRLLNDVALNPSLDYTEHTNNEKSTECSDFYKEWPHYRPKTPPKWEDSEEDAFDLMKNSTLSVTLEDLTEPSSDLMPIKLSLSDLFPSLSWNNQDLVLSPKNDSTESNLSISKEKLSMRQTVIDRKEYQSGSLLDRWARFESPPRESTKKEFTTIKSTPFSGGDCTGCSAFRTSNTTTDTKEKIGHNSNRHVASLVEVNGGGTDSKELNSPTTPPSTVDKGNNVCNYKNGSVHSKLVTTGLLSKRIVPITSCRKKNYHFVGKKLQNKIIMRIPKNKEEILDSTQLMSNECLQRKPTHVLMEVT